MTSKFVYFIGGPADLTKRAYEGNMGDIILLALAEWPIVAPDDYRKSSAEITLRYARYNLLPVGQNTYVAIYQGTEI